MKDTACKTVRTGSVTFANNAPVSFIAGPCVIESEKGYRQTAKALKKIFDAAGAGFVLKASFDKANRTSVSAFRGPGIQKGLEILRDVKAELDVPVIIDVHEAQQAEPAAEVADILQIPAFLCRQTDLLIACGMTGKPVNIKKGQFLSPWDIVNAIRKVESTGNRGIMLTERGTTFGYNNLVVDMRALEVMKKTGYPVIFDCTHSVQRPGGMGTATGGDREFIPALARAAAAVGVAGIFFEAHPNPGKALSDGPNSLKLNEAEALIKEIIQIDRLIKGSRK